MNISPEGYVERLYEATNEKFKLLLKMLELTKQQSLTINEDDLERLTQTVTLKQEKINEINQIDEDFDVYFQGLKRELKVKSLEEIKDLNIKGIKELQESIGNIIRVVKEISEIENINNDKAKDLLNGFKNEIKKLNHGKMINSAYNPRPMQSTANFIDKKK